MIDIPGPTIRKYFLEYNQRHNYTQEVFCQKAQIPESVLRKVLRNDNYKMPLETLDTILTNLDEYDWWFTEPELNAYYTGSNFSNQ